MGEMIEIGTPVGGFENVPGPVTGALVLRGLVTEEWGVDASGPYFDPDGAAIGEHALLTIDADGGVWIEPEINASGNQMIAGPRLTVGPRRPRVVEMKASYRHGRDGRLFGGARRLAPERGYDRRGDGRLFGPSHAPAAARSYERQPDGRLMPHADVSAPERAYARGEDGRLFGGDAPRAAVREYDRRPDGRLMEHTGPAAAERAYERRDDGRLFAERDARAPVRHYDRREDGRLFPRTPIHADR